MAGSLFDRLTKGEIGEKMDEDESIRLSLLRMLTTRQGAVQTLPDYGLPDLNDLTLTQHEIIIKSSKAIEECINQYEPRLSEVKVSCERSDNGIPIMKFYITGTKIDANGRETPWNWSIKMHGNKVNEE